MQFRSHVNTMRSTAAHVIRANGGKILPLNGNWVSGDVDRSQIKELQDLITINGVYKQFPPILFPDASMKQPDIFRSEIVAKVSSYVLWTLRRVVNLQ